MINLCLAADRNYLQHLFVAMASVLVHAGSSDRFRFILLSDGSFSLKQLDGLKRVGAFDAEVINAADVLGQHMVIHPENRWPVAAYYRVLLPFICPAVSKVIYLDCDTLVRTSLKALWDVPLEGKAFAAVADFGFPHRERLRGYGIHIEGDYCNSGVAVMDLDRMRSLDYPERLRDAERKVPVPEFADQDWLNIMFNSDKLVLPIRWNVMSHLFANLQPPKEPYPAVEIDAAKADPFICHFTNVKPWTFSYTEHPFWYEYWELLKRTPYRRQMWKGYLKKALLSDREGFFFRKVRPALKRLVPTGGGVR
jgi:lipopolysaccharide biosynthesis glycosyltransferase